MIKALDIATQGMMQAERRANDLARDILKSTSESASFKLEDDAAAPSASTAPSPTPQETAKAQAPIPGGGFGDLIQQMADLKATELTFKANAKVFKTTEETLGSFLDAQG